MRFKRAEYFRFEFEHPIDATFRVIEVNGLEKISHPANVKIQNLSPHGMRILTNLNLQLELGKRIKAEIQISLNENTPLIVNGMFVWQKEEPQGYSYGIEIEISQESEKKLIEELKTYSKGTVYIKR